MLEKSIANSAKDYVLESAILEGPNLKSGASVDVTNIISDIDIFEHLDKPYITGSVVLVDGDGLYSKMGFTGIETLAISIRLPEKEFPSIKKKFYVDKVVRNVRTNDYNTVLVLHLIEDIGFLNKFVNVNKSYEGKGYLIIERIVKEFVNKELSKPYSVSREGTPIDEIDAQDPMRVIIPNMNPLDAADWIKDRITTTDASPYYLFSAFANDKLHLMSLRKMLVLPALNKDRPFNYSQAATSVKTTRSINEQAFIIESYTENATEDLSDLNDKSFINTSYIFYDVNTATKVYAGYDPNGVDNDRQEKKRWSAFKALDARVQKALSFGPGVSVRDIYPVLAKLPLKGGEEPKLLWERPESNTVTNIFSSSVFTGYKSYNETTDGAAQLLKVDAKALRNWIINVPVDITLPGRMFIMGTRNTTVGNKYRVEFLITDPNTGAPAPDPRKTGDYLVYAARHTFSKEGYIARLTVVKVRDDRNDISKPNYIVPPTETPTDRR